MCAAQSNAPSSFGTYTATWGYADNSRGESVVEISPNINYTVSDGVRKLLKICFSFINKKKTKKICVPLGFLDPIHIN